MNNDNKVLVSLEQSDSDNECTESLEYYSDEEDITVIDDQYLSDTLTSFEVLINNDNASHQELFFMTAFIAIMRAIEQNPELKNEPVAERLNQLHSHAGIRNISLMLCLIAHPVSRADVLAFFGNIHLIKKTTFNETVVNGPYSGISILSLLIEHSEKAVLNDAQLTDLITPETFNYPIAAAPYLNSSPAFFLLKKPNAKEIFNQPWFLKNVNELIYYLFKYKNSEFKKIPPALYAGYYAKQNGTQYDPISTVTELCAIVAARVGFYTHADLVDDTHNRRIMLLRELDRFIEDKISLKDALNSPLSSDTKQTASPSLLALLTQTEHLAKLIVDIPNLLALIETDSFFKSIIVENEPCAGHCFITCLVHYNKLMQHPALQKRITSDVFLQRRIGLNSDGQIILYSMFEYMLIHKDTRHHLYTSDFLATLITKQGLLEKTNKRMRPLDHLLRDPASIALLDKISKIVSELLPADRKAIIKFRNIVAKSAALRKSIKPVASESKVKALSTREDNYKITQVLAMKIAELDKAVDKEPVKSPIIKSTKANAYDPFKIFFQRYFAVYSQAKIDYNDSEDLFTITLPTFTKPWELKHGETVITYNMNKLVFIAHVLNPLSYRKAIEYKVTEVDEQVIVTITPHLYRLIKHHTATQAIERLLKATTIKTTPKENITTSQLDSPPIPPMNVAHTTENLKKYFPRDKKEKSAGQHIHTPKNLDTKPIKKKKTADKNLTNAQSVMKEKKNIQSNTQNANANDVAFLYLFYKGMAHSKQMLIKEKKKNIKTPIVFPENLPPFSFFAHDDTQDDDITQTRLDKYLK